MKVSLRHEMFIGILHPVESPCQEYPLTLTARLRFHYKCLRFLVIELEFEIFGILGEDPSGWEEIVVIRAFPLHRLEVTCEKVLSRQSVHAREVIHSLVRLHLEEELGIDCGVQPVHVPVGVVSFGPRDLIVEGLCHIPQHIILRILQVYY